MKTRQWLIKRIFESKYTDINQCPGTYARWIVFSGLLILTTFLAHGESFTNNSAGKHDPRQNSAEQHVVSDDLLIQYIYFGSTSDPLNGLTITWKSFGESDSIRWGYTGSYEEGSFSAIKRSDYAGYLYDYHFPQLKPDSVIYYKIYDSMMLKWTEGKSYKCATDTTTAKFSFLVMGDSQSHFKEWNSVSGAAGTHQTNFTLFAGDIVEDGSDHSYWNGWFEHGAGFLEKNLVYHTIGNHDCIGSGKDNYPHFFTLPGNPSNSEYYYSFTYGNALFICLNSEEGATGTNPDTQYNWLLNVLEENKDKTWKFAWYHRPFCSAGPHQGELYYKMDTWFQAFDDYGVDMMFSGHEHMYERSKPVQKKRAVVSNYGSGPGEGRCQIVTGGAGASLHTCSILPWLETAASTHNYCKIDINDNELRLSVFDEENNPVDSLTIRKNNVVNAGEYISTNKFSVYPNPAGNQIVVQARGSEISAIRIFSVDGSELTVLTSMVKTGRDNVTVDVSALPGGMYIVQANNKKVKFYKK